MPLPGWGILLAAAHFAAVSLGLTDSHEQNSSIFCWSFLHSVCHLGRWLKTSQEVRKSDRTRASPASSAILRSVLPWHRRMLKKREKKSRKPTKARSKTQRSHTTKRSARPRKCAPPAHRKIAEKYARILKKYQAQAVARTATNHTPKRHRACCHHCRDRVEPTAAYRGS